MPPMPAAGRRQVNRQAGIQTIVEIIVIRYAKGITMG